MPISIDIATPADAARIAEIHMAAFSSNLMLRAQFPTATVRGGLQKSIEQKTSAEIADPKTTVLIARDSSIALTHGTLSKIISFAKWAHPVAADEEYEESPWIWPHGTNWDMLDAWYRTMDEVEARLLGSTPCYRLHFIATDPSYEKRGAASLLLQWGIQQSLKDTTPAYVESTLESAPFYKKHGFKALEKFGVDITGAVEGTTQDLYEEISLLYQP